MKRMRGRRSWAAALRTWWLTVATVIGSTSLLAWAAWTASIDLEALPAHRAARVATAAAADERARVAPRQPQPAPRAATNSRGPVSDDRAPQQQPSASLAQDERQPETSAPGEAVASDSTPGRAEHAAAAIVPSNPPPIVAPMVPPIAAADSLPGAPADPGVEPAAPRAEHDSEANSPRRSISGWVFDESGAGVPNIPIVADGRRMFADGPSPPAGVRTQSDGTGAFAFRPLPDGEYQLRTTPNKDYDTTSALVRSGSDAIVLTVRAKSGSSILVHGAVEGARGRALDSVRVEVVGHPAIATFSDAQGRYALRIEAAGRLQRPSVRFTRKGYRDFTVPLATDSTAAATDIVQDARLEPVTDASTLSGSVRGNDGTPVAGAKIELYSAELGRSYAAASDRNGSFVLTGLDNAADFRLWVRPVAKYRDRTLENVISGGSLDVIVEAISSATVAGRFVSPDGQPVPGFTMWLTPAYGANRAVAVRSDGQGAFSVADVPEGPFVLGTRGAPLLSVTGIQASSASSGDLRVPLDVGAYRLEGALTSDAGEPVGGARVALQWSGGLGLVSTSTRETVTDANGYFLFTQLGAGTHTLAVTAAGFRSMQSANAVGPVNAPIALTLQRGH